jgi:hypothetical protein
MMSAMWLIDLLLNRKNITFDWIADPKLNLVVDLDESSFCGVPVGRPLKELAGLGPADDRRGNSGILTWDRRGFYLVRDSGDRDRMKGFVIDVPNASSIRWRLRGREVTISPASTRAHVRQVIGAPFHEFHDEQYGEHVWFYETPHGEWQFTWNAQETLQSVEISASRELDDPGSRADYGCTIAPPYSS